MTSKLGDVVEFEDWYRSVYQRVLASMVAAAGSVDVGKDATDEAFARALERWDSVSVMDSPSGWVYTVALNVVRRRGRRRILERRSVARWRVRDDRPPATLAVEVWDALRCLSPRERQAVALRYLGGLGERQVAEAMGLAEGTVARLLHDARRQLAAALAVQDEDERSEANP